MEPLPEQTSGVVEVREGYWEYSLCSAVVQVDEETWESWIELCSEEPMRPCGLFCFAFMLLTFGGVFTSAGGFVSAAFLWIGSGMVGMKILLFFVGMLFVSFGGAVLYHLYETINKYQTQEMTWDEWNTKMNIYKRKKFFNAITIKSESHSRGSGKDKFHYTEFYFSLDIDKYRRRKRRKEERHNDKIELKVCNGNVGLDGGNYDPPPPYTSCGIPPPVEVWKAASEVLPNDNEKI